MHGQDLAWDAALPVNLVFLKLSEKTQWNVNKERLKKDYQQNAQLKEYNDFRFQSVSHTFREWSVSTQ
jgi:hypothetical protein